MTNFWKELPKPAFMLAPMEDVTDTSFREIVLRISNPEYFHVIFTEFTSTDGLCHPVGRPNVISRLLVNPSEREVLKEKRVKIVVQIWGTKPEKFYQATKMICDEFQFDGVDINLGCPVKKIVKQGACSALIGKNSLVAEIIQATREASNIPVSVKTRTGVKKHDTENWIGFLLEQNLDALILHARTQKDQSEVPADWNEIAKAVNLKNQMGIDIPLYGNGDVTSVDDAFEKCVFSGADGVMVGTGIFHNPWFFNHPEPQVSTRQRLGLLMKHVDLYTSTYETGKNFAVLKRFFKIYTSNFDGAVKLRAALMETTTAPQVKQILDEYLKTNPE